VTATIGVVAALAAGACGAGARPVTPAMVDAAREVAPDASAESLERGRVAFSKKCHDCHPQPDPKSKTPEQWSKILEKMGKLAGLDAS
jgi:cytochrome c5